MVLIGLLLIALICLVLGLVLPSSAWLIASLIASTGAGYLLWRARKAIGAPAAKPAHAGTAVTGTSAAAVAQADTGPVTGGAFGNPSAAADDEVWVIDGRPRYHLAACVIIQGQDAEPIPYEQATDDGFMPCSLCEPNLVRTR